MIPPRSSALLPSLSPKMLPAFTPRTEMANVMTPMMTAGRRISSPSMAMLIPTAKASMLVATASGSNDAAHQILTDEVFLAATAVIVYMEGDKFVERKMFVHNTQSRHIFVVAAANARRSMIERLGIGQRREAIGVACG